MKEWFLMKKFNWKQTKKKKQEKVPQIGVIHVPNSRSKYYKTKKRGVIGKQCKYFNHNTLACTLTKALCISNGCEKFDIKQNGE